MSLSAPSEMARPDPSGHAFMKSERAGEPADAPRRRVRFVSVELLAEPAAQRSRARVTLEWQGELYTGESVGEAAGAIELRTAARAALLAVQRVSDDRLRARLVGVKQLRAFDADMIVVAVTVDGDPPRQVVGAVLTGNDALRAAAAAVLQALNRILGNHIAVE